MTTIVKSNTPIMIPSPIQRRAGIKAGDQVEFKVSGGIISILPKLPDADEEYTPEQRKVIDARLAAADDDVKKGRVHGPFTAAQATRFLKTEISRRASARKPKPRR